MDDLEKQVLGSVRTAMADAIKQHLGGYGSPLQKYILSACEQHSGEVKTLVNEAIGGVFADADFRKEMLTQIRHKVARELTHSFGEGIFKKTVEQMKGDPTVRARCVLAVEQIVEEELRKNGHRA